MPLIHFLCFFLTFLSPAWAGTYSQVTNFGDNRTGTKMYIYVPTNLSNNPAILVAIHWCSGTAQAYYSSTPYAQYAESYGFIVIYPESPYSGTCWDVSSKAALTHDGGADTNSIANMVRYTLSKYNGDSSRVFATGTSSGAMMTNVLAATYPDIFSAGIAYSGVPAGCFYTGTEAGWNSTCSQGNVVQTPAQWAQVVKDMYPGYTGSRPKMQIYHGSVDNTLYPNNYNETIKQWSGIFGYSSPVQTLPNTPSSPYVKYVYGPNLEGIYGVGIGHSVPVMGTEDLKWLGLTGGGSQPTSTTTTKTTSTTTGATPTNTGVAAHWGQCGGQGWTGPTTCESPYTCTFVNNWYSQCL